MSEPAEAEEPERTAVYRIRGEAGGLLYIGMTNHVAMRWNHHQRQQPWWGELRSLTVDWHGSREEAAAAEKAAIQAEWPKYNKTYLVPRGRKIQPPVPEVAPEPPEQASPALRSGRLRERMLAPDRAAEFLGITEDELREYRLRFYDLDQTGRYIRYDLYDLRVLKAHGDGFPAIADRAS